MQNRFFCRRPLALYKLFLECTKSCNHSQCILLLQIQQHFPSPQALRKSIRENIEVLKNLLQNPKLKEIKEIESYIKDDSFHAFGHLIFPSKTNNFQLKPHFDEWRKLDSEIGIFLPEYLPAFVRRYVSFIRSKKDFFAKLMWLVLEWKTRK